MFHYFTGQADILCLFYVVAPTLAPLVYEADHSTQVRLRDYVVSHVFTDLEEDEPEEEDGNQAFPLSCSAFLHVQIVIFLSVKNCVFFSQRLLRVKQN